MKKRGVESRREQISDSRGSAAKSFSLASLAKRALCRVRGIGCSAVDAGWNSLLVQSYEVSGTVEYYENAPSFDQMIVLMTKGICEIKSFSGGV